MSKEEINALPIRAWDGPVVLVKDDQALEAALSTLRHETLLGFDTETRPIFTKG